MRTSILAGARGWAFVLAIAVLAAVPLVLGKYAQYLVSMWLVFAIATVGLNIPIGLANIYSFGHGAFMLIGAYAVGVTLGHWGWNPVLAVVFALALAGITGAVVGLPSLRLTGFALAIVTFAFGHTLFHVVKAFEYTGGPQGLFLPALPAAKWWAGRFYYYLVLACFALCLAGAASIAGSRTGRALRTLGSSEVVAQSLGVNLLHYKIAAFVLSAVYGALSGCLLALVTGYVAPDTYSSELSISVFAAVMIGGIGTLAGPVLGAFFVVLIPEFTQSVRGLSLIIYGVLFTVIATLYPAGMAGALQALQRRWARRRQATSARSAAVVAASEEANA
jgi:branched-chain amino acid transport system permease protein